MQRNGTVYKPIEWGMVLAALLVSLALVGCGQQQDGSPQSHALEVSTFTVQVQRITETVELPGRTSAFRVAEIRPQVNGLIQKRLFTEGSNVKAGQVLYQIDPAPFQAALDNAEAALGRAEANLPSIRLKAQRFKTLVVDKAVSQQDYDDAAAALTQIEADIKVYKAALQTARINLGYTKVTAPIAGRIGKSNVTDGAIVTAYQATPLATIQQMDPLYVDVPQSTTSLLRLKRRLEDGRLSHDGNERNQVKLILEDGAPYPEDGTLEFRDVSVDPTTGSVILRMIFPNPNGVLLPEMFVRAIVNEGVNERAMLIPQQAVARNQKGDPYAMVVGPEDKVDMRMLTVDRAVGNKWLVSSGLAIGDRVIVEGLQKVRPGAVVKAVPFTENESSSATTAQSAAKSN